MSAMRLEIDGKPVEAEEGATLVQAAASAGVTIPTLCQHDKLEPYGGCRVCMVEIEKRGRAQLVAACVYTVEDGLVVRTRSDKIDRVRKTIVELLLAHAPDSPQLLALAEEYGAVRDRFEPHPSFCVHCGLCVRYCAEVKKADAVGFIDRGSRREIGFVPHLAATVCWDCKECFSLCPTSALQAAYVLTTALVPPEPARAGEASEV